MVKRTARVVWPSSYRGRVVNMPATVPYRSSYVSNVARAAGAIARAGLRQAARTHPVGRAAVKAYDVVKAGRKLYSNLKRKNVGKRSGVTRGQRYITKGSYAGPFRKVTSKGNRDSMDKYNRDGVVFIHEAIGNVTNNDSVYVLNEAVNSRDCIFYMLSAMFRRLLEKAGCRIRGANDAILSPNAGNVSSTGYIFRLVKINLVSGVQVTHDFTILAATTFNLLCEDYRNEFEQYATGHGELNNQNVDELFKILLLFGNAESQDVRAEMLFNETFIDFAGKSQLKVQNRTKATGGSEDAENINNNPLQGRSYLFKGVPKPKANGYNVGGANSSTFPFERLQFNNAVSAFGGTGGNLDNSFKEPPSPRLFWNCFKASRIRLEPGDIKSYTVFEKHSGNILKLLKKFRLQLDAAGVWTTYSAFKCQMIALEDVINANAAETISIQYELERTLGVKCWTKQRKWYKSEYALRT